MKNLKPALIVLIIFLFGCVGTDKHTNTKTDTTTKTVKTDVVIKNTASDPMADEDEIRTLVRNMLLWAESKKAMNLVPVLTDKADSLCIGFDLKELKVNAEKLKATGFFAAEFIDNYEQIILTLDKKMKNKEFTKWSTGELPPFSFANDVDPWCNCQDVPYDKPNAYALVDVKVVNLSNSEGELYWMWGSLPKGTDPSWKDITYHFKVKRENGKWKISYLQGFDLKQGTQVG